MFQEDGAIRIIEGPEPAEIEATADDVDMDADRLSSKFKKFVREFGYTASGAGGVNPITLKYRNQFLMNMSQRHFKLEVNLSDLNHDDWSVLGHNVMHHPTEFVPLCEKALQDLYRELVLSEQKEEEKNVKVPHIQLLIACNTDMEQGTFGKMKPMEIRQLTSDYVEKLVVVQGIVYQVRKARHKARKLVLKCRGCEAIKTLYIEPGFTAAHIPPSCDGGGALEKCPANPFSIQDDLCEYIDEQVLTLQELPEDVPVGEMPRSRDLFVNNYLVDLCKPGTRLTALGTFCATEKEAGQSLSNGKTSKGVSTVKYSYLLALGMQVAQGNVGQTAMEFTAEEEERFRNYARTPDHGVINMIYKSIAPSICASTKDHINEIKKAIASLLFGGSMKQLADGTRMRGDINVLLIGDPGTAKSQFLKFTEKAAPICVYTSGKGSSAAGLTAAIRQDAANGFVLEGGAMVLADGGVVCIDEFDKMDAKDRVAIHEAMEQQTISIAKAGITTMLNTRCSVLAAANPRAGTFDDLYSTFDQMDFESTILSRFDMMFLVKDVRDPERDVHLARHMTSLHQGEAQEEREGPLSVKELRKYISYCRGKCHPRVSPEAAEVLKNHYVKIRAAMKSQKQTIPITVRQLEAVIRISESLAKMELCEEVDVNHVEEALTLFTVSTLDAANTDRVGVGIDMMTEQERDDVKKAEEQLKRLLPLRGRKNKFQLETDLTAQGGIEERAAKRAIYMMTMRGELTERINNTITRVR